MGKPPKSRTLSEYLEQQQAKPKTEEERKQAKAHKTIYMRAYLKEHHADLFLGVTSYQCGVVDPEDVVGTRDTIDDFSAVYGKPSDVQERDSGTIENRFTYKWREAVPSDIWSQRETFSIYVWHIGLEAKRRLYVVDFGDVRAACMVKEKTRSWLEVVPLN